MLASARPRIFQTRLIILAALAATGLAYSTAWANCAKDAAALVRAGEIEPSLGIPTKRYPKGVDPAAHPNWHLQFGFESEYLTSEIEGILTVYAPKASLGLSSETWRNWPAKDRMKWVEDHMGQVFPSYREPGNLELAPEFRHLDFLPPELIRDSTGNVEIVVKPIDTLEEWYQAVAFINTKFDYGSMQATVSTPNEVFFGAQYASDGHSPVEVNKAFFRFTHELQTIEKLESGYARYANDPTKEVARSFMHPFLGPMTTAKDAYLSQYLEKNATGSLFDAAAKGFVSGNDASFKYIGGTVYRPDLAGPSRTVLEMRDAHKTFPLLMDRMRWAMFNLQHSRQTLLPTKDIAHLDGVKDFAKMPAATQALLQDLFPNKRKQGVEYSPEELLAIDVFRNFAYPYKDFNGVTALSQDPGFTTRIENAKLDYQKALDEIGAKLAAGTLDRNSAGIQVQGALAKFAHQSGIGEVMRTWMQRNILASPAWTEFTRQLPKELRSP